MYNFCKKEGIEFEFVEKATAQHNGAAERLIAPYRTKPELC